MKKIQKEITFNVNFTHMAQFFCCFYTFCKFFTNSVQLVNYCVYLGTYLHFQNFSAIPVRYFSINIWFPIFGSKLCHQVHDVFFFK